MTTQETDNSAPPKPDHGWLKVASTAKNLGKALVEHLPFQFTPLVFAAAVFGIGIALELIRKWVIVWLAPEASRHATVFAVAADVTIDSLEVMRLVVNTIETIIKSMLNRHHTPNPVPQFKLAHISAAQVVDASAHVRACSDFSTRDAIVYFTKHYASPVVCPLLRSAKPIPYLNDTLIVAEWLTWDPTPYPGNNCDPLEYTYGVEPQLCAMLQMGGIMLEILLPIVIVAILLKVAGKELVLFLLAVIEWVVGIAASAWRVVRSWVF